MNLYRTKFLEEEWRVKLAEDTNWVTAKYKDGCMKFLQGDRWLTEDKVVFGKKEFGYFPIAKIPPGGYKMDQYSKSSIQYLEWVAKRDDIKIQHALNGGEIGLPGTRYKLDGYSYETNTTLEYNGCVYHGGPMFSRGQRRDETPSDAPIYEPTPCSDHQKEILYRKSRNEIRVYVGTRI